MKPSIDWIRKPYEVRMMENVKKDAEKDAKDEDCPELVAAYAGLKPEIDDVCQNSESEAETIKIPMADFEEKTREDPHRPDSD